MNRQVVPLQNTREFLGLEAEVLAWTFDEFVRGIHGGYTYFAVNSPYIYK